MLLCIIWQAWHSSSLCVGVLCNSALSACRIFMMECLDEAKMNYESKDCGRRSTRLESDRIQCPA